MESNNHDIGRDRQKVAGTQDWEVEYVASKFNVSKEKVQEAIDHVGNSRDDVEEYLKANVS